MVVKSGKAWWVLYGNEDENTMALVCEGNKQEVGSYISEYLGVVKSSFKVSPGLKFKLDGKPYKDKGAIYSNAIEMKKKDEEVFGMSYE